MSKSDGGHDALLATIRKGCGSMETSIREAVPALWLPELMLQVSKQAAADVSPKEEARNTSGQVSGDHAKADVSSKQNHLASAPLQADNGKSPLPYSVDTLLKGSKTSLWSVPHHLVYLKCMPMQLVANWPARNWILQTLM